MSLRRGGIAGRKRRTKIDGQFIAYTLEMIESSAWRVLSFQGRKILNRLEIEHCAHGGAENGRLPCRYHDFEKYGCRRKSISRGLTEIEALGFAKTVTFGTRAYGDIPGKASTFVLTYLPTPEGPPTHDWKKLDTLKAAKDAVTAALREHQDWLDAAEGSPRHRQRKTKRQGAICPRPGGEVPPNVMEVQGAKCNLQSQGRNAPTFLYLGGYAHTEGGREEGETLNNDPCFSRLP
jgi:hypothetical protein